MRMSPSSTACCPVGGGGARAQFRSAAGGDAEIPDISDSGRGIADALVRAKRHVGAKRALNQEVPMDHAKVEALAFRMVGDMAASFSIALGHVGDRLGLFRAMKGAGPLTSEQLASKTGLNERYVREWLKAMVAAEYLDYDPASARYVMTPEQAYVLADDTSPMSAGGPLQFTAPTVANTEKLVRIFRDGGGIPYSEIGPQGPQGIARFFRPGYLDFPLPEWLPPGFCLPPPPQAGIEVAD